MKHIILISDVQCSIILTHLSYDYDFSISGTLLTHDLNVGVAVWIQIITDWVEKYEFIKVL